MKYLLMITLYVSSLFAQPSWIDNPNTSKYIGGVGIVQSKLQRRVAVINFHCKCALDFT